MSVIGPRPQLVRDVFIADENGHVDETLSSLDSVNLKDYAIKVGLELVQEDEYSDSETAKGFSPEVLRMANIWFW